MEGTQSQKFAIGFIGAMVILGLGLVLIAERSVRSRETWSIDVSVERVAAGWSFQLRPTREIHLYAVAESGDGQLQLLFPLEADSTALPLRADVEFERDLRGEAGTTLLVFADPRPLWSLEEARFEAIRKGGSGPLPLETEALLEIRGLGPLPASSDPIRVSRIVPPGENGSDEVRGLWARRFS